MLAAIIALLLSLGIISDASEYENLSAEEQEQLHQENNIIIEDLEF